MAEAFGGATAFNGDIGDWDVSNVSEMTNMFSGATSFNGDISGWDVTNVDYMQSMFNGASSFNQDISGWDVSPIDMYTMFNNASNFNQDISGWDVTTLAQSGYALAGSGISTSNYTKLLLGWSTQILPDNVGPGPIGGTYDSDLGDYINLTPYCTSAQSARDVITGTYNWSITDGGSVPCKTVTYIADAGGALVGDVFQYIADGESGTAVTATPAEGFRFVSWSDGSTQNPRTDSSLSSNLTLTAVFASTGGDSDSTKIGLRAERLLDVLSEVPVIGSIATFVTSVRDFLNYLTEHEAEIEKLTPEERTKVITTLRDIIAFLLKFVPGV
jgi:surface protein